MKNYGVSGTHSANFHWQVRLISDYQNKLLYNIFTPGVIPESPSLILVDEIGDTTTTGGVKVKIPSGFSFLIYPNNEYSTNTTIQNNFNALSDVNKNILRRQTLKCDIVKDFYVTPDVIDSGWLVAEYNYLDFADLPVEFYFTSNNPSGTNLVVLALVISDSSYLTAIDESYHSVSDLNTTILYEMNVDTLDGYDAGATSGTVPISTGYLSYGLNTEMVNGFSGSSTALKWAQNSGFNIQFLADEFSNHYQPGTGSGAIPISAGSGVVNDELNTELLSGSGVEVLEDANHTHYLDTITDGVVYRKPLGVNTSNLLTHDSFKEWAFTRDKIHPECFFAENDDLGGRFRLVTGEVTVTANYDVVPFSPTNENVFLRKPHIMLQIVDDGTSNYNNYHIKLMAHDVSTSNFRLQYTIYEAVADGITYEEKAIEPLTIHYIAWGYADEDIE
jgi:hypothetical protein